jgi:mono/diheme cytochrome c family protein
MEARVVPTMAPLVSAFDPERYVDFGCATCHGSNARVRSFAMPNAER